MKPSTSARLVHILGFLVIVSTLSYGHLIDFLPSHRVIKALNAAERSSAKPSVCETVECRKAAAEIVAAMDTSVDPCEDFYSFACGAWKRANPVPPTEGHRGQFDIVHEMVQAQVRALLESEKSEDEPAPVRYAQATYAACMDEEALERVGIKPLAELSEKLGSWPMASPKPFVEEQFNPFEVTAKMKRFVNIAPLISVRVKPDMKNASVYTVVVDQPSLALPRSILEDPSTYPTIHSAYIDFITDVALVMAETNGLVTTREKLREEARDVVDFEVELAKLTARDEMRRKSFRLYNLLTLKELQQWTDAAPSGLQNTALDWLTFLHTVFADVDIDIETEEKIVVFEVDFLFNLMLLVNSTSARTVANFVQSRLVLTKSADTTKQMRELHFQFRKLLQGTTEKKPRWEVCSTKTSAYLAHAVGHQYVHNHFDKASKESAEKMVTNIRAAFSDRVAAADWMDRETKKLAREKAEAMTDFVAYPDWYNNRTALEEYYRKVNVSKDHFENTIRLTRFLMNKELGRLRKPVDKSQWLMSAQIVNAAYSHSSNAIVIPAGILHSPGFVKGRPEALNYGGIGMIIAHEVTHGFDDVGRQFDKNGQLADWWSSETLDTFVQKARCLVDQYGGYTVPELEEMVHRMVNLNGAATQGENIADCGGLDTAFSAYQRYTLENGPEPALPGLERFSSEQLFFIGSASVWCESITKEQLLQGVLDDPHSPNAFRVKGSMSNSAAFSKAFSCPSGSPMNPARKCTIW